MKCKIIFGCMLVSLAATAQPTPWQTIGPAPQVSRGSGAVSGRVNAIIVRPSFTNNGITKPTAMFIAPEGGGLWQSTNFESAFPIWSPVLDNFFPEGSNIWSLAVSNNNPREICAGSDNGILFRSHDGGTTWEKIKTGAASTYQGQIIKVIMNPISDQIYFTTKYTNDNSSNYFLGGVYRQAGNTNTFSQINNGLPNSTTIISDLDYAFDKAGNLSLYLGTSPNSGVEPASIKGIWRFSEATGTWTRMNITLANDLATGNTISNDDIGTVKFACDHNAGFALGIYAAVSDLKTSSLINVYKLVNDVWTPAGTPINSLNSTISTYACLILGMSLTGEVYLGCGNVPLHSVYQSTDGGGHWSSVRNGTNGLTPHNDERSLYMYNGKVYLGNDGGIDRFNPLPSFQAGPNTWESLNTPSLPTIMVNGIGIHPTDPSIMLCGSQDNAVTLLKNGSWNEMFGGDGSRAIFDPVDPSHTYTTTESKYDFFYRSDDGGKTWTDKSPADANDAPGNQAAGIGWYAPFDVDNVTPGRIVVGIDRIYMTNDRGDSWGKQKSPIFFPMGTRDDGRVFGSTCTAIAIGGTTRIWAAYGGALQLTENNGGDGSAVNWKNVTPVLGFGGTIIQICVNPANPDQVYLGIDNGTVWKSTKSGNSWTWSNVSGTKLSFTKINTLLLLKPVTNIPILFVGTNRGIFFSVDDGVNWWPYNNGLPQGNVTGLDYQVSTNTMICGVYGRSIYKLINPRMSSRTNLPTIKINLPIDNCNIPPVSGSIITLSFTLTDPSEANPFVIQWKINGGGNPVPGETYQAAKCKIEIPTPAQPVTATVELTYTDGVKITASRTFNTVDLQQAALLTFFCKFKSERMKPINWWEWDPAKWRLDPKTNTMVVQPFTRVELTQIARNLQVNLQNVQEQLKKMGH